MLNKEKTSRMIKVVALFVAAAFVVSFIPLLYSGSASSSNSRSAAKSPSPNPSPVSTADKIKNSLDQGDQNFSQKNYAQAANFYQQALSLDTSSSAALSGLGATRVMLGQADTGYSELAQSIKIDPNQPEGQFYLGEAAVKLGKTAEAKAAYNSYLKLRPAGDHAAEANAALDKIGR